MNRLLIRRCSMSSIEEEDESTASDEQITQIEKFESIPLGEQEQLWDSELSESEQEFDDNNDNLHDNSEEQAANRAFKSFMQSCSTLNQTKINNKNVSFTIFPTHIHDDEGSIELDNILSDLEDFKIEFQIKNTERKMMNNYSSTTKSSTFSTNGCVNELRTLEDQLEAALASLTLTINDCTGTSTIVNHQQSSSDSSACSSGLGDDITNDLYHLYNISTSNNQNISFSSKLTSTTDDCDSAFSDSGSTDKVTLSIQDESLMIRSMMSKTNIIKDNQPLIVDNDDFLLMNSQHPSKILVRTYNDDGSTKSIFIDDTMFVRDVLFVLIHKNHRLADINYVLVEVLPDLHMERIFEDHQKLTEAILMWPTVSSNRLCFTKRIEKYSLNQDIISNDELLNPTDIEGYIYLKEKSRKSWKKYFCVLRSSGLYFIPKGKSKKDLICLAKFENVELFFGLDWKKKFKSPTDFCFAFKHPLIQKKSSKFIKYMCVDTKQEFDRWIINIRIAKFGQQLKINYLLMDKAINFYRSSGRFTSTSIHQVETKMEQQNDDLPIPIVEYHSLNEQENDNSPIKSPSYMDELRERLERVVNNIPIENSTAYNSIERSSKLDETIRRPTLIPPPKFKSTVVASTPLPRKQMQTYGNLSYRTVNPTNQEQQQQMSKSFIISPKREDHKSSLSIASKSDSIKFNDIEFSPSPSCFLENLNISNKIQHTIKSIPIANNNNINRLKQVPLLKKSVTSLRTNPQSHLLLPIKTGQSSTSIRLSTIQSQTLKQNNSFNYNKTTTATMSINNKPVPPVPPRKSSIPRPTLKPQIPQRNFLLRKPHISHL